MYFSERLKLEEEFEKWAQANDTDRTPFDIITWLDDIGMLKDRN